MMGTTKRKKAGARHIFFPWEKDLNPAQRIAVETINGPLMVLAGAGSGKTRIIAYRIAYLVASRTVSADKILALTFTNKAANEMRSRILKLIQGSPVNLWIGTFHSIFARILRREASKIGSVSHFSIYDGNDQLRALKHVIEAQKLAAGEYSYPELLNRISYLKSRLVSAAEYASSDTDSYKRYILSPIYSAYTDYLKINNAFDFDDLLLYTYQLFRNNQDILRKYRNRFKYILVDEFQDTNLAQYRILIQLADQHRNICVVGDDDQSIYRWRGAEIKNILQFEHDFPNTKVIRLEQNYRSTKNILNTANSVIKNNSIRHDKTLWTEKGAGEKIVLHQAETDREEAAWVAQTIESEVYKEKWDWGDFAILYRMNAQSRLLEDNLRRKNIPYTVVGGLRFYERKEVKDVLAYLGLVVNPADAVMLKRVINFPHRGIGKQTLSKIEHYADERNKLLFETLKLAKEIPGITAKRAEAIYGFYELISKYRKLRKKVSMVELVSALIEEVQILRYFQSEGIDVSVNRLENIRELMRAIEEYASQNPNATLENYLSEIALLTDIDTWKEDHQHVSIITLHSAKGLEFPVVYIIGLEEGVLPIESSLEDPEALEEERRLFYVGATRAKDILHISSARLRGLYGQIAENPPSRFLSELDKSSLLVTNEEPAFSLHIPRHESKQPKLIPASQLLKNTEYTVGLKVVHPDFGVGYITEIDGHGSLTKLKVMFEGDETKNLMAEIAPLSIIHR